MIQIIGAFLILWSIGGFIWSEHFYRRIWNEVLDPWKDAIANRDWRLCDFYKEVGSTMLQDFGPLPLSHLSPIHWMETWNKQYVAGEKGTR